MRGINRIMHQHFYWFSALSSACPYSNGKPLKFASLQLFENIKCLLVIIDNHRQTKNLIQLLSNSDLNLNSSSIEHNSSVKISLVRVFELPK